MLHADVGAAGALVDHFTQCAQWEKTDRCSSRVSAATCERLLTAGRQQQGWWAATRAGARLASRRA